MVLCELDIILLIALLMFYSILYFKPIPFYILQLEKDYMYVIEKLRF